MKTFIKKIFSPLCGRVIYLVIGVLISLAIFSSMAAWDSPVSSGQQLTAQLWNDLKDKVVSLDSYWSLANGKLSANYSIGVGTAPDSNAEFHIKSMGSENNADLYLQNSAQKWGIAARGDMSSSLVFQNLNTSTPVLILAPNGNVGIGTDDPGAKLDVKGSSIILRDAATGTVNLHVAQTSNNTVLSLNNDAAIGDGNYSGIKFYSYNSAYINGKPQAEIRAYNEPAVGSGYGTELQFYTAYTGTINPANQKMVIKSNGNVGIGTDSPTSKLYVSGGSDSSNRPLKLLSSAQYEVAQLTGPAYPSLLLTYDGGNTSYISNYLDQGLAFRANGPTWDTAGPDMIILDNGNVGIGTSDPGSDKLDVRGRAYASGGWQTVNADYAEWFEKEEDAAAGDIIGINLNTGKARKYRPGDKFIGICSVNSAFIGNRTEEAEGDMKKTHLLAGLLGQLEFNKAQVIIEGRVIKTKDKKEIGILLSNGKALIGR